jgi:hypothetical protein
VHDAYQDGLIDDHTRVLPDGTFQWCQLSDVCDEIVVLSS